MKSAPGALAPFQIPSAVSIDFFAAVARCSGVRLAVVSKKFWISRYCCGPSSGMISGSSGESFARRAERSTVRRRLSSSRTLVVADARFLPKVLAMVTVVFAVSPDVVTCPPA